jgi:hypothetical protein
MLYKPLHSSNCAFYFNLKQWLAAGQSQPSEPKPSGKDGARGVRRKQKNNKKAKNMKKMVGDDGEQVKKNSSTFI